MLFVGIEDCNAEWQSRGRTEIILKFIAVNLSTSMLVAQLGSCLGMSRGSRAWFVIRTTVNPLWCSLALLLQLSASVGTLLHEVLEGDTSPIAFLACKTIGMVSNAESIGSDDMKAVIRLPQHVPLSEARCFFQADLYVQDPINAESAVQFRYKRLNISWISRIINIFLTLIYIVQATATIILVFRRSTLDKRIPLVEPFTSMDTHPLVTITPFEYQAILLCAYGVLISIVYILLQIFPVQWTHLDNGREWNYIPCSRKNSGCRMALGYITLFTALFIFLDALSISKDQLAFHFSASIEPGSLWYVFLAIMGSAAVKTEWPRLEAFLKREMKIPEKDRMVGPKGFAASFFCAFDYARQDPTEFYLFHTHGSWGISDTAVIRFIYLYIGKIIIMSFGLVNFITNFSHNGSMFEKAEMLSTSTVSASGCVFETKLVAWMWKDPLADLLWAF